MHPQHLQDPVSPPYPPKSAFVAESFPTLWEFERKQARQHILEALRLSGGRKGKAAELLGVTRQTLYARLQAYGINSRTPQENACTR